MDALTQVRQDHRKLEGLLERCEQLDGDDEERDVLLGQLQSTIRHHVGQEESLLYTIFRERARRAEIDLAPLDRAVEQHRLIDRLSNELTDGGPGDTTLKARLTVLAEQVHTHLDDENTHLLTAIEDLLDDDTLMELGRRMEQRDRILESRRQLATVVPGSPRTRRLAAALGGLRASRSTPARLELDHAAVELRLAGLVVANGQFSMGRMKVAPRALPDDGRMSVIAFQGEPLGIYARSKNLYYGDHVPHPTIREYQSRRVTVDTAEPVTLALDGWRAAGGPPLTVDVLEGVLRVKV